MYRTNSTIDRSSNEGKMRREFALDHIGKKGKKRSMERASVLSSPLSFSLNQASVRSVARFGNPESIIIDSKRRQIRNWGEEGRKGGREEGRKGEGGAGLPGANRRNAVSIIQLKTDMYIGIRWELSQSLRLSIARRLSDDRSGSKIEGGNAIVALDATPFAHPLSLASLRCKFDSWRSEVFESRGGLHELCSKFVRHLWDIFRSETAQIRKKSIF